jgi:hypothetical protein
MANELPILFVPDELKCSEYGRGANGFSLKSNLGTLQLWIGNNVPGNTSEIIYVFDSQNLSNFAATYYYADQFTLLNSSTGSFSVFPSVLYQNSEIYRWFYYVFRILDAQFSNCHDTNLVHFASPFEKTFILNATANTSGNCLSSILIPYVSPSCDQLPPLPIMYISSINYVGPSSVKVLSTIYNESYELFEFSEADSTYLKNFVIYGNLINFVIPPNGALQIEYEILKNLESAKNITEYDFEDYGFGIMQSSNYTVNASIQYMPKIIKCTKGIAEITIKLIYAGVPVGGYLHIYSQNQSKIYQNGIYTNETIIFNTVEVTLDYSLGTPGQTSTGD